MQSHGGGAESLCTANVDTLGGYKYHGSSSGKGSRWHLATYTLEFSAGCFDAVPGGKGKKKKKLNFQLFLLPSAARGGAELCEQGQGGQGGPCTLLSRGGRVPSQLWSSQDSISSSPSLKQR